MGKPESKRELIIKTPEEFAAQLAYARCPFVSKADKSAARGALAEYITSGLPLPPECTIDEGTLRIVSHLNGRNVPTGLTVGDSEVFIKGKR